MSEAKPPPWTLLIVKEVKKSGSDVRVTFINGVTALLKPPAETAAYSLRLVERSQQRGHPVGVRLGGANVIADVARAPNDTVGAVTELDEERWRVRFQGHDGLFALRRDHPDAARIRGVLDRARQEQKHVWFVTYPGTMDIADVALHQPAGA